MNYKDPQKIANKTRKWNYPAFKIHSEYEATLKYTDGSVYRLELDGSIRKIKERNDTKKQKTE